MEAGAEAETMGKTLLTGFVSSDLLSCLSEADRPSHLHRDGTTQRSACINQSAIKKMLHRLAHSSV